MEIKTGRTAIARTALAAPLRLLLKKGYLDPTRHRVFDLGHGRGDDMRQLAKRDFVVGGWDPNHSVSGFSVNRWPMETPCANYNFVYCGYVLNVLERSEIRLAVVQETHAFLKRGGEACFATRSLREVARSSRDGWTEHNDGWITTTGTFQHGATPAEVVDLLDRAGFHDICVVSKGPVVVYGRK